MKRIGIDCRLFGPKDTGIGRYTQNLVKELLKQDQQNYYFLFVRKSFFESNFVDDLKRVSGNFETVLSDIPHYSFKEQFLFPFFISKKKIDFMHFTHFNVPFDYSGPFVVTIHDLIKHFFKGKETTTRSSLFYFLKYFGYQTVFKHAVLKSKKIIVPSNTIKNQIVEFFKISPQKLVVTYEGVFESNFGKNPKDIHRIVFKYQLKEPFVLYVGNLYPHKNVENLIKAIGIINLQYRKNLKLVIVCSRSVFSERISKKIKNLGLEKFVLFTGHLTDEELSFFYHRAEAFVFPSLSEGFGLPGLEAMSAGCPVICSDISVFREVYQNAALYFDPTNPADIAQKVIQVVNDVKLKTNFVSQGFSQIKKYSWEKTAKQTLKVYQEILDLK